MLQFLVIDSFYSEIRQSLCHFASWELELLQAMVEQKEDDKSLLARSL
jgi:hypothetical protein